MTKTSKRIFLIISGLFLSALISVGIIFYSIQNTKFLFNEGDYVYVPVGATLNDVIYEMESKFNINLSSKIKIYTKFNSLDSDIKPGRHDLSNVKSISDLLNKLTSNLNLDIKIQIIEGRNIFQIASQLNKNKELDNFDSVKFVNLCLDSSFISQVSKDPYLSKVDNLEGFLFPDTYRIGPSYSERDIIKVFVDNFLYKIDPYRSDISSIVEVLTIASIVEAETQLQSEMDTVASLYYNRIKDKIPLQSDPTVLYYMSQDDLRKFKSLRPGTREFGKLWRKYKKMNNPYNTYKYMKPPGPINSPGINAIASAIYPASTDYLFMFSPSSADYHIFNRTNAGHERAIRLGKDSQ